MDQSAATDTRVEILIGCIICLAVVMIGTIATIHFASPATGELLDIYKVGGAWLIVGAIAGRVVYNARSDKAKAPAGRG
jgi:hypothetical protein